MNTIPRTAKKLEVQCLFGDKKHMIAKKDEYGWHGTADDGKRYGLFVGMLRNSEVCRILVLE